MFDIGTILPSLTRLRILDLGAMRFPGEPETYDEVLSRVDCSVLGFDALPEECKSLNDLYMAKPEMRFLPYVIGDGSEQTLHVCSLRSRTSLYRPNLEFCRQFAAFSEYMEVVAEQPVQTRRLDDIPEIGDVDWVKMDIQGAELDAILGGVETLSRAVVVETEVEFVEQYQNQPLFAEVDQELRRLGFMFHTFMGYGTRPLKAAAPDDDPRSGFRQWLWADAVYVPHISKIADLAPTKLLKLAYVLHSVYGSYDFAHLAMTHYDHAVGSTLASAYLKELRAHRQNGKND